MTTQNLEPLSFEDQDKILVNLREQGITTTHPLFQQVYDIVAQRIRQRRANGMTVPDAVYSASSNDILAARDATTGQGGSITVQDPRTGPGNAPLTVPEGLQRAFQEGSISREDALFILEDQFGFTPEQAQAWVQDIPAPRPFPPPGGQPVSTTPSGLPGGTSSERLEDRREFLSGTPAGRGDLFNRFLAANPQFLALAPQAQRSIGGQEDQLQAQFAINSALQGLEALQGGQDLPSFDFRDFLQQGPGRFDPQQARNAFQQFAPLFRQQLGADDPRLDIRNAIESNAPNLISQFQASQANPFLRPFVESGVNRRIAALRDQDIDTPTFLEFINRGFRF